MSLELTRNRLKNLAMYGGTITIEGEHQNEIVIRIPFGDDEDGTECAEHAYDALLDIEDDRCEECGRYTPNGTTDGLCKQCHGVSA